ncbi:hypothetical protein RF11_15913 [Thelohanellus kitauei]|uniref:Uncharacterized protein n=1 Tax=Thelohanellus kitauei TaxID=669202 RepID=A0A0C2J7J8_THEKT|nr:hypothetical protein RF11_15913 [Thelohanellus kitauei]
MNISVELNVNLDYLMSKQDLHSYKTSDITKFDIELKQLNIVFENKRTGSWLFIRCHCEAYETLFEIENCRVLFRRSEVANITNSYVGYTFNFNRYTKYVLSNHFIRFNIRDRNEHMVMFNIYKLMITFGQYTKKYTWDMKEYIPRISYLHSHDTIEKFEEYEGEYTDENDRSLLITDDASPVDMEAQENLESSDDIETNAFNQKDTTEDIHTIQITNEDIIQTGLVGMEDKDGLDEHEEEMKYDETNKIQETNEKIRPMRRIDMDGDDYVTKDDEKIEYGENDTIQETNIGVRPMGRIDMEDDDDLHAHDAEIEYDENDTIEQTNKEIRPMGRIDMEDDDDVNVHEEEINYDETNTIQQTNKEIRPMGRMLKQDDNDVHEHDEVKHDDDVMDDDDADRYNERTGNDGMGEHYEIYGYNDIEALDESDASETINESLALRIKSRRARFIQPKDYYQDRSNWIWEFFKKNLSAILFILLNVVIISSLIYAIVHDLKQVNSTNKAKLKR